MAVVHPSTFFSFLSYFYVYICTWIHGEAFLSFLGQLNFYVSRDDDDDDGDDNYDYDIAVCYYLTCMHVNNDLVGFAITVTQFVSFLDLFIFPNPIPPRNKRGRRKNRWKKKNNKKQEKRIIDKFWNCLPINRGRLAIDVGYLVIRRESVGSIHYKRKRKCMNRLSCLMGNVSFSLSLSLLGVLKESLAISFGVDNSTHGVILSCEKIHRCCNNLKVNTRE